jgi:ADP-dependent NAD(P)H-hydrate dehydratase
MNAEELDDLLAAGPLPVIGGDKIARGDALIVAGDPTCPGAAILAATGALRAGAGRVQIVTHPSVAMAIGVALPEAFVTGWDGRTPPDTELGELAAEAASVLIGPGLGTRAIETARNLAPHVPTDTPLLLDALSLPSAPDLVGHRLIVMPNTDEAGRLADTSDQRDDDPSSIAASLANQLGAVVAVRGPTTVLTDGRRAWEARGHPALGTAGSGDVLAGLVVGLTARGVEPLAAAAWGIAIHTQAGSHLGGAVPRAGYLAGELLGVIDTAIDQIAERLRDRRS